MLAGVGERVAIGPSAGLAVRFGRRIGLSTGFDFAVTFDPSSNAARAVTHAARGAWLLGPSVRAFSWLEWGAHATVGATYLASDGAGIDVPLSDTGVFASVGVEPFARVCARRTCMTLSAGVDVPVARPRYVAAGEAFDRAGAVLFRGALGASVRFD